MKKIYLICPVRKATKQQIDMMRGYVETLEGERYEIHWPLRDVDQSMDAYEICKAHAYAMMDCDEVHVWLDNDWGENNQCLSQGSMFDLGMAFLYFIGTKNQINFRFVCANGEVKRTDEKSFLNVLERLISDGR